MPVERAIQTLKNSFINVRSGVDTAFLKWAWNHILEHVVVTLNMLCPSRLSPQISAYMQLHGIFDFNETPIAPAGCKIIIRDRTNEQPSWVNHESIGFYVRPAFCYYRNYVCFMSETKALWTSNTVDFFQATFADPITTAIKTLSIIMSDLLAVLQTPLTTSPMFNSQEELAKAITTLQSI